MVLLVVHLGAVVAQHWQVHHGTWLLNSVILVLDGAHLPELLLQEVFILLDNLGHRGIFLNIECFGRIKIVLVQFHIYSIFLALLTSLAGQTRLYVGLTFYLMQLLLLLLLLLLCPSNDIGRRSLSWAPSSLHLEHIDCTVGICTSNVVQVAGSVEVLSVRLVNGGVIDRIFLLRSQNILHLGRGAVG